MKKVLVINHDYDLMGMLQELLEIRGYEVVYTAKEEEAIERLNSFHPDFILIDLMQQYMIENLRGNINTDKVPMLVMTGYDPKDVLPTTKPDAMIQKPFSMKDLELKIDGLLKKVA